MCQIKDSILRPSLGSKDTGEHTSRRAQPQLRANAKRNQKKGACPKQACRGRFLETKQCEEGLQALGLFYPESRAEAVPPQTLDIHSVRKERGNDLFIKGSVLSARWNHPERHEPSLVRNPQGQCSDLEPAFQGRSPHRQLFLQRPLGDSNVAPTEDKHPGVTEDLAAGEAGGETAAWEEQPRLPG